MSSEKKEGLKIEGKTEKSDEEMLKSENSLYTPDFHSKLNNADISVVDILKSFIKQVSKSVRFYRVSIPIEIIQPVSMLERYSCDLFLNYLNNIHNENDPLQRFMKILKWQMAHWSHINRVGINNQKPYNPIIGEFFTCKWEHKEDESTTYWISEQVSHHPPISVFHCENEKRGFVYKGSIFPSIKLGLNSFTADVLGNYRVQLKKFNETYLIKCPKVCANGIFVKELRIEVFDKLKMYCEKTGLYSEVEFVFSGDGAGKVEGFVGRGGKKEYTISGSVADKVNIQAMTGKREKEESFMFFFKRKVIVDEDKPSEVKLYFNAKNKVKGAPKIVKPLEKQQWNESRRNWHKTTRMVMKGKNFEATKEKQFVENRQRNFRKDRKEKNVTFTPKYFEIVDKKNKGKEGEVLKSDLDKEEKETIQEKEEMDKKKEEALKKDENLAKVEWGLKKEWVEELLSGKL